MKKTIALGLSLFGLTLVTPSAMANSDYPASDYQPKVVYIDKEATQASSGGSSFDPDYPAANFQPKVVYLDKTAASKPPVIKFDPNYPAAYFQPKVIYP